MGRIVCLGQAPSLSLSSKVLYIIDGKQTFLLSPSLRMFVERLVLLILSVVSIIQRSTFALSLGLTLFSEAFPSKRECKGTAFFQPTKQFWEKNQKKLHFSLFLPLKSRFSVLKGAYYGSFWAFWPFVTLSVAHDSKTDYYFINAKFF